MSAVLRTLAKYGAKAIQFAIAHKDVILKIIKEIGIQAAISWVLKQLGLG
jgi:peptidoglycan/xylan/chitin deacetylase (PgdA/CDA1 family)